MAIGSCVPSYVGRHMLRQAMEYSGGVNSLVNQGFFSSNWIGVGTSLFSENSLRPITQDQLIGLMDVSLDTQQFIVNSLHSKKSKGLWSYVGEPKTIGESLVTPYEADRVRKGFIVFSVPVREPINIKNNLSFATSCFRSPRGIPCPW